jgi:hypothetical protein
MGQCYQAAGVAFFMASLTACTPVLQDISRDLDKLSRLGSKESGISAGGAMMADSVRSFKTQVVVPGDSKVETAFNEALPTIKKVLAIHQCIPPIRDPNTQLETHFAPLRQLNQYALPGVDAADRHWPWRPSHYIPMYSVKYHNPSVCLAVQMIDTITMPAQNAMKLRAVFVSVESGELVKFNYEFQKWSDGTWRLRDFINPAV